MIWVGPPTLPRSHTAILLGCTQLLSFCSLPRPTLPHLAAAVAAVPAPGEVKDKVQLYQMANLGVRLCWWAVMTWLVVLLAGCAVFAVYVSNMHYMMEVRAQGGGHFRVW